MRYKPYAARTIIQLYRPSAHVPCNAECIPGTLLREAKRDLRSPNVRSEEKTIVCVVAARARAMHRYKCKIPLIRFASCVSRGDTRYNAREGQHNSRTCPVLSCSSRCCSLKQQWPHDLLLCDLGSRSAKTSRCPEEEVDTHRHTKLCDTKKSTQSSSCEHATDRLSEPVKMRFRLVTVVALLAIASTGEGRPSEPGSATLDSGYARIAQAPIAVGSLDSRYISRRKTSMSSSWRRNNSINTTNNPSQSSRWHGHTVFPRLRFESESKRQYLPLGAMSSVKSTGSIPIKNQSNGRSINHNPLSMPTAQSNKAMIKSAPRLQKSSDNSNPPRSFSTFPIPVSLPRKINIAKEAEDRVDKQFIAYNDMIPRSLPSTINRKNYVNFQSVPTRVDKKVVSNRTSTPKPIPVTISHNAVTSNVPSRNQRKMLASRTLVRLVPTLLKTGPNSRRNSTTFKSKLPSEEIYANSWPNEALQNVHDLLNYENGQSAQKDPNSVSSSDSTTATYPSTYQSSYQTGPTSYPSQGQINDYYSTDKNPGGQALSDRPAGSESDSNSPIISTLELFQNTQINIGGNKPSQSIGEAQDEALSDGLDSAGTNADGSPLTDPNEATNDITGTAPANNAGGATNIPTATAASADAASGMFTAPDTAANDVGTAESLNSGTSGLSLPSIPNLPSLPNLPNLPGGTGNLLGGSGGSQSELTALAGGGGDDEDDFEEEILDALSPAGLQKQSRELKDIQSMDQSLRTVATQLLNSTSTREEIISMPDDKIETMDTPIQVVHVSTLLSDASPESHNDGKESPTRMKFGIPVNSKFGHFEVTNPGHAMAMTEEEIEREMATATPPPKTTTGMLSTWIHLYPQSTATEEKVVTEIKAGSDSDSYVTSTTTKLLQNTVKLTTTTAKPKKTETSATTLSHKSTEPVTTTKKVTKFTGSTFKMSSTTPASVTTEEKFTDAGFTDTTQEQITTQEPATTKTAPSSTTKKPKNNATQKVKNSSKNPGNKPQKSGTNRVKVTPTRRPSLHKNESVTSTSRIEKVTLRPTTLSLNRNESTDKPHFVTKIKASLMTDGQKTTPATSAPASSTPTNMKPYSSILLKSNFTNAEKNENKIPSPTQVNNFMKVQVKKPIISDTTKIEIQPIQVNPPVLTIEKIGEANSEKKDKIQQVTDSPSSVVKVTSNVELAASERPSSPTTITAAIPSTTTKKPRGTNKRKKNKNRRRKQSTTSTTTAATPTDSSDEEDATFDTLVTNALELAGIQESKIEPESKIPPKKKKTTPNTQVQKPFGTQIYNFLSREVMPSVGVMSLVGLGLGLASYFLYPFGSVISRRNYEVEPNYKYNLDEYGGNYGLSEEEVLSKVYSGMTPNQHNDKKYPTTSEKSQNYYRYSGIETTTRYPTVTKSANRVIYRPVETTAYDVNYRNNEFKYPDVQTTPNYYERQRQNSEAEFVSAMSKMTVGNNRQFVVGNIPKEYESEKVSELFSSNDKLNHNLQFATEKSFSSDNMPSSATTAEPLGNPAALISQSREDPSRLLYDDMEISPDAVAIEHGPRSFGPIIEGTSRVQSAKPRSIRVKRSMSADTDSVIQMIPTKSEIAKEKQEEEQEKDLSNEIVDIIDEALPGNKDHTMKKYDKKEPTKMTTVNNKQYTKNSVPHADENNKSSTSSSISVPNTSTHK
ncbi:unnamed protein product [Trichogramma brassicae]|uniref:Uncharacterized protein n=1 Tax=Trichogramma brassicae TaxID=86971 RepID=A0A6H5J5M3_9HYME|nr:unnamed protein product [Trichogramma brassicae]